MKGKLIVIEGIDGSGKSTQYGELTRRLTREEIPFKSVSFPRYDEQSSALIRMYLAGDFGKSPGDVSPYAASAFYAVDRFASFKTDWGRYYQNGGVILCDRYTTSNAVHQSAKLEKHEREPFFRWLEVFEYQQMGLPAPDMVIFLDMPADMAVKMMEKRKTAKDIHENDIKYLESCASAANDAAEYYKWRRIVCVESGQLRGIGEIAGDIYREVSRRLGAAGI